jgi:hypothetical protein
MVKCWCDFHHGVDVSYYTRKQCHERADDERLNENLRIRQDALERVFSSESDCSDESDSSSDSELEELPSVARQYALGVFLTHISNNTTQEAVERELCNVNRTLGTVLPIDVDLPQTRKQLVAMFRKDMYRLVRIPVCVTDCQLLDAEDKMLNCPTCGASCSRISSRSGKPKPAREFCAVVLADVIREWFADKRIAKLLRYPTKRQPTPGEQKDVFDGKLWLEFEAKFGSPTDLAWALVCDPVDTNKRKKHSVTPRKFSVKYLRFPDNHSPCILCV